MAASAALLPSENYQNLVQQIHRLMRSVDAASLGDRDVDVVVNQLGRFAYDFKRATEYKFDPKVKGVMHMLRRCVVATMRHASKTRLIYAKDVVLPFLLPARADYRLLAIFETCSTPDRNRIVKMVADKVKAPDVVHAVRNGEDVTSRLERLQIWAEPVRVSQIDPLSARFAQHATPAFTHMLDGSLTLRFGNRMI